MKPTGTARFACWLGCAAALAAVLTLGLVAPPTVSAAMIVDDFVDPVGQVGWGIRMFNPFNPYLIEHTASAGVILGGERELQLEVVDAAGNIITPVSAIDRFAATGAVGDGTLDFGSSATSRVRLRLMYDGNADGVDGATLTNSLGLGSIDLTANGQNAFRFDASFVDAGPGETLIDVDVIVTGPGGPATAHFSIPESASPAQIFLPYSAFSTLAPLSAATSVEFVFNSPVSDRAVDFTLTRIEAVPEPSTLALAGLGLAGLYATWRRRHGSSR